MTKFRTHYDNLQISRSASLEVIKAAYRTLSAKYHPDRNQGDSRSAEIMSMLNSAYAVLSDDAARREHDAWIKRQEAARASRPAAQAFARGADHASPFEAPAWSPTAQASDPARWSSVKSRSAATEAALAQGRVGKLAALIASGTAACLLVFALLSEQGSRTQEGAARLAPAPAASTGAPAARQGASEPDLWLMTQRNPAPRGAIDIATAFARSEGVLGGKEYAVRIHDDGEVWLISYRNVGEGDAAAPIVLLDKGSMRVIGYYARGQ